MGESTTASRKKMLTGIQIVLAIAVVVCVVIAGKAIAGYMQSKQSFDDITAAYAQEDGNYLDIDFAAMQAEYPNAVAWIQMDDLDVSYPIMQSSDNEYYLHHGPKGASSSNGSIFLDCENASVRDSYALIFGHNMKDGSMFGSLQKYTDGDFYQQNSGRFTVYTPQGAWRYQIFAVAIVDPTDELYSYPANAGVTAKQRIEHLQDCSMYNATVDVAENDQIITLSTCSNHVNRLAISAMCIGSV